MEILETKALYKASKGNRTFLTLFERLYRHGDRESAYFYVSRNEQVIPPEQKLPDAVVIVAVHRAPGRENRLVLIDEYRLPIGCREISIPAGLIDAADYEASDSCRGAVVRAATRELKEETGLDLIAHAVSPSNLYSSAGLTNESVALVIGEARGEPCTDGCEPGEDIKVVLADQAYLQKLVWLEDQSIHHSKTAWPFIWHYAEVGLGQPLANLELVHRDVALPEHLDQFVVAEAARSQRTYDEVFVELMQRGLSLQTETQR